MTVIVNATPLIALAAVNHLDLLPQIFDNVIVPQSVYNEITFDRYGFSTVTGI